MPIAGYCQFRICKASGVNGAVLPSISTAIGVIYACQRQAVLITFAQVVSSSILTFYDLASWAYSNNCILQLARYPTLSLRQANCQKQYGFGFVFGFGICNGRLLVGIRICSCPIKYGGRLTWLSRHRSNGLDWNEHPMHPWGVSRKVYGRSPESQPTIACVTSLFPSHTSPFSSSCQPLSCV